MAQFIITKSVTAQNEWTEPVMLRGFFNISITGIWEATVTLQRAFDGGSIWLDVGRWNKNAQEYVMEPENNVNYRMGVKTGEFTSGTISLRLSQ